jgi:hypothetical protein
MKRMPASIAAPMAVERGAGSSRPDVAGPVRWPYGGIGVVLPG